MGRVKEYEKHILDAVAKNETGETHSLCGKQVPMSWCFLSVSHAFQHCRVKGRLLPCNACLRIVLDAFGMEQGDGDN